MGSPADGRDSSLLGSIPGTFATRLLVVDELGESSRHFLGALSSEIAGDGAVVVNEDVGRDQELVKPGPTIGRCVKGVLEAIQAVLRDEQLGMSLVASTGHADEEYVVTEVVVCLCDRRGFTDAVRSPWSPEPQEDVLAFKITEIDLSTIKGWNNDIRQ